MNDNIEGVLAVMGKYSPPHTYQSVTIAGVVRKPGRFHFLTPVLSRKEFRRLNPQYVQG